MVFVLYIAASKKIDLITMKKTTSVKRTLMNLIIIMILLVQLISCTETEVLPATATYERHRVAQDELGNE